MKNCRGCENCKVLTDTKQLTPGGQITTIVTCTIHGTFDMTTSIPCQEEIINDSINSTRQG